MVRLSPSICATLVLFGAGLTEARPSADLGDLFAPSRALTRRQITNVGDAENTCPIDSTTYIGQLVEHFTGIFFGDFTTEGGQDILGPLAVRGNFHAPNYLVNANHAINCGQPIDDLHAYDTIGLIVGGQVDTTNTNVHGDSYVAGGGTIDQLHSLDAGCTVHSPVTAYAFDWDTVQNGAISASVRLASYAPNIVLQGEGAVSNVGGDGQNAYYIFTFDTCPTCDITGPLSDSSAILFGQGNYNGPTGDVPTEDSTVVFNIPVLNGATIDLTGNQPSQGWYSCRTIYNFYPVDTQGNYVQDGEFTLLRHTGSQLEGLILAPRGHILDGTTGAFAGLTIGLDYGWENGATGVEIHDFVAAGCPNFDGCFPDVTTSCVPTTITATSTVTSTITSPTTTTSTATITSTTTSTTTAAAITSTVTSTTTAAAITSTVTSTTTAAAITSTVTSTTTAAAITSTVTSTTTAAAITSTTTSIVTSTTTSTITDVPVVPTATVTDTTTLTDCTATDTESSATETVYAVPHVVKDKEKHKHKHWRHGKCKGDKDKGGWKRGWNKDQGDWEDKGEQDDECYYEDWAEEENDEDKGWDGEKDRAV